MVQTYFVYDDDVPGHGGVQYGQRHGFKVVDKDAVLSDLVAGVRSCPRQPFPLTVAEADDVETNSPTCFANSKCSARNLVLLLSRVIKVVILHLPSSRNSSVKKPFTVTPLRTSSW